MATPAWPLRVLLLLLFGSFVALGTAVSIETASIVKAFVSDRDSPGETGAAYIDFPVFYGGAKTALHDPAHLYDRELLPDDIARAYGYSSQSEVPPNRAAWFRQYNPPFYLLLLAPLSLLGIHIAYLAAVVLNVLALTALIYLLGTALHWHRPGWPLLGAATFSFLPIHAALLHGQPNVIIAALVMGAFLAAERQRTLLASLLLAFTSIKPQWAAFTSLAFLRGSPRALLTVLAVSGTLFVGPFLVIGVGSLQDYAAIIRDLGGTDLTDSGYSAQLHNWGGFFRALTGHPQPSAVLGASAATLAALALVFLRGERELTWSAALMATIISAHASPQDWVLAIPAAVFLIRRPMPPAFLAFTVFLLLAIYSGIMAGIIADDGVFSGSWFIYWHVLAAFALIMWCAALPPLEERFTGPRGRPLQPGFEAPPGSLVTRPIPSSLDLAD
jgi:hypothetical protein